VTGPAVQARGMRRIALRINGRAREGRADPRRTLADFLRHDLGLTGTHLGCEHGVCGACTILWDGQPVRSCLTLAVQADGADLLTVEGLAPPDGPLSTLQEAFRDCHALQCGFCTPGILMTMAAFLGECPDPSEQQIREALSGNLCRCTGYVNIIAAVRLAADRMAAGVGGRGPGAGEGTKAGHAGRVVRTGGGGRLIGAAITRTEDDRLLRGLGKYLDDLDLPGALHVAFLRSPHAHAIVDAIDVSAARAFPGVVDVVTAADLGPANRPLPLTVPHPALRPARQTPLATDRVLYVGQPVAAVAAVDPYVAEDAVERIAVSYRPLPASLTTGPPLPGAPPVFPAAPDNVAAAVQSEVGDVEGALSAADVRVTERLVVRRGGGQSMEGRGVAAAMGPDGILTLWSSTQGPHVIQRGTAEVLDLPLRQVRVVCPDIGGGFGPKLYLYPEEVVVPFLARRLGRPVRWVEDRREHFLSSVHEGEQVHEIAIGLRRDGTIVALRDRFTAEAGADLPWGIVTPTLTAVSVPGPYRVPNYAFDLRVFYGNKVATAPVRGAGRPQASFVMDRILDRAAGALGMDPAELRRRNLIPPDAFPYPTGLIGRDGRALQYDSGNYPEQLRRALEAADYTGFREAQRRFRAQGRFVGIGIGFGVESTSLGPLEGATVRVEPSGRVHVLVGSSSQGQGHETAMAQICAEVLGVPMEAIRVTGGRTDDLPYGTGTFASRIGAVAGTAVALAAGAVRDKALTAAAALLEANRDDLVLEEGRVHVRGGPGKALTLGAIAHLLSGPFPGIKFEAPVSPGLEATEYFQPESPAYSASVQVATVEVDPELGAVHLLRHVVVHDCGRLINPLIVEGQVHGGMAHGLSDALFEELRWDAIGQPLATSYMEYLLPTACEMPERIAVDHVETPTPLNPLGVKGAGEGGTIGCAGAVAGAIEDALAPLSIRVREIPITPAKLHAWIAEVRARTSPA